MMTSKKIVRHRGVGAALALSIAALPACDDFLDVQNPNNLEAENVDAERDAAILSRSAYQSFVATYGTEVVYSAWFTNEARVGDTFPTRNDFGRRDIPLDGENGGRWNAQHTYVQYAERTIKDIEPIGKTVDLARAYFTSGWGMLLIGTQFCEGTIAAAPTEPRAPITSAAMLDSAMIRLAMVNTIAATLPTNAEAQSLSNAALVGIARIHLQNGRKAQASQVAAQVPANFTYNLLHQDDPNNRGRLGNTVWSFSEARISLVVGPEFRAMADAGDTRIAYSDRGRVAQDGVLNFFRQAKIAGWATSDRLASSLEADYIRIEADANPAAMFAFINARRAVGRQALLAATTDMNVLLRELMEQKARDFWLEGKRMADFRRLGNLVPYVLPPGDTYYKPSLGGVSTQTCWPVPGSEIRNNPLWPKT